MMWASPRARQAFDRRDHIQTHRAAQAAVFHAGFLTGEFRYRNRRPGRSGTRPANGVLALPT